MASKAVESKVSIRKEKIMHTLYQATIMDHYRHPRNRGALKDPDFCSGLHNPSCGDSVSMEGRVAGKKITELMFEGKGCVISQGVASLLTKKVIGSTLDEIQALDAPFMQLLCGMPLGPTRLRCALLPLQALQAGVRSYVSRTQR